MIKSIYSQNLEQKNVVLNNNASLKNVSEPKQLPMVIQGFSNYSLVNLKANYMPISFRGDTVEGNNKYKLISANGIEIPWKIPEAKAKINVSDLPKESRHLGDYWGDFSDDLAVILKSDICVKLEHNEDADPDIFVHSFANHFSTKKATHGADTRVFLIHDSKEAAQEAIDRDFYINQFKKNNGVIDLRVDKKVLLSDVRNMSPLNLLMDISKEGAKRNIVFVKDYDYLEHQVSETKYSSLKEFLFFECPNISVVGLSAKKPEDDHPLAEAGSTIAKMQKTANFLGMELVEKKKRNKDIITLELPKMSTDSVKEFLNKNPEVIKNALDKYIGDAKVKISPEALDVIVDKAAQIVGDLDTLEGSLRILDITAAAKITETGSDGMNADLRIDKPFVKKFLSNHSTLVDLFKEDSQSRFKIAENISTTLDDVGGIGEVKQKIKDELIAYLKNPKKYVEENGFAPKGVLLEGPTGTGKTLIARAIAGETNTPFIFASGSEFVEMYVGVGASRIRELFAKAKKAAEASANKTAIIFIDEFDALAKARSNGKGSGGQEHEQTLNQLLIELDGFDNKDSKTKIVVLAATNRKDTLDPASIRPGRFDDLYKIDNPASPEQRLEILDIHARKLKFKNDAERKKILDEAKMITDSMSGAEIAEVLKKAQKVVSKRTENKFITINDVVEGFLQVLAGPVQKLSEDRPFNDVIKTVRHEAGHAATIDFLKPLFGEKISFITLDSRGDFLGAVFHHAPKVNHNFKSVILSAAVSYAGGLAEPEFDNLGRAAGARGDINSATKLFRRAITEWGQGVYTPPISFVPTDGENVDEAAKMYYQAMLDANKENILKDTILDSKTAEKIAKISDEFQAKFLDEYVERFKNNAGKGGNNLSGEEFAKMRQEWLVKTGKVEKEKELLKKVERILDNAYSSNKGIIERLAKKVVHTAR